MAEIISDLNAPNAAREEKKEYRPAYAPSIENLDANEDTLATDQIENTLFILAGKIGLEAVENKIIILIDKFKTGYECKDCNETGVYSGCACALAGRFGIKDNGRACHYRDACAKQVIGERCKTCNGTGIMLNVPQNARGIPTSGMIVSAGPKCTSRKINERVLFGAHTGYFLPFKGNAKLRCMREDEVLCLLHAIDNQVNLGDFVQLEEQQS